MDRRRSYKKNNQVSYKCFISISRFNNTSWDLSKRICHVHSQYDMVKTKGCCIIIVIPVSRRFCRTRSPLCESTGLKTAGSGLCTLEVVFHAVVCRVIAYQPIPVYACLLEGNIPFPQFDLRDVLTNHAPVII